MNQISNERSCKGIIIVSSLPNIFSSTGHNICSLKKNDSNDRKLKGPSRIFELMYGFPTAISNIL